MPGIGSASTRLAPRAAGDATRVDAPVSLTPFTTGSTTADELWQPFAGKDSLGEASVSVRKGYSRIFGLDQARMEQTLAGAPLEGTEESKSNAVVMTLPMPDGTLARFRVEESPVMEPALAAQFPLIRTYRGQGIDDQTATARIDMTPLGFHGQVLAAGGTVYVDPYNPSSPGLYITYNKRGLRKDEFQCLVEDSIASEAASKVENFANGGTLRTYRLALATTGEYATAVCNHNGVAIDIPNTLAAMTTSMNRVNGVYERELSVHMNMVANETSIIFTNASTDPYSNTNPSSLLTQNQSTCDSRIGSANYDIGHVFSTGGGGLAGLGVVCGSRKAQGETGSGAPYGDGYDIDYVAHEMGHQFGGDHTFIGTRGSCSGNGNASTAYERGSGSTIQAYAGICGTDDLQPHSDDYFHTISLNEITNYLAGTSCAVSTSTGDTVPVLPALTNFTNVPVGTTFTLTAPTATDADGDTLTYCWEDWQTGSACDFRPTAPTTSPSRTFANVSNPTAGNVAWEVLPTTAKTKTFRCTVRDNRSGGGAFTSATMTVAFVAGAFSVTAPNTAVSWTGGSTQTVTWTKGGSTAANVKISLSTNGGSSWSTVVASTPNDGSEAITVPNTPSTTARIKVEPTDNVYFDVSNVNFTITAGTTPTAPAAPSGLTATAVSSSQINLAWADNSNNETGFKVEQGSSSSGPWTPVTTTGANATSLQVTGLAASTTYFFQVRATNAVGDSANAGPASATTQAVSVPTAPAAPSGLTATATSSSQINLAWADNSNNETGFKVEQGSSSSGPWTPVTTTAANATAYSVLGLNASTTYFFRVRATNAVGDSANAGPASATTQAAGPSIQIITCSQTISGALAATDSISPERAGCYADVYKFVGTGRSTRITLSGPNNAANTYLYVKNASNQIVASNDNISLGNKGSKVTFTAAAGVNYTIECTTFSPHVAMNYTISVVCQ